MTENHGRQPTLNDVALRAGVSRQTVSRVVNNKGEISEATRQRVLEVIHEVGYHPNALARSLVTNTNHVVGLSLPYIDQPYFPKIARGVEDAADAVGYSVFLCNALGDPKRELRAIERLRGHRVAGIISFNSRLDDETVERATGGQFPVVMINRELPEARGTIIWPGYETGAWLATEHLIQIGRRRITFVGLDLQSNVDSDKQRGYESALQRVGIAVDPRRILRTAGPLNRSSKALSEDGLVSIVAALDHEIEFDAVFASNDMGAIGAMRGLIGRGALVPEDVAIVGFGGASMASLVTPTLSTVTMPLYEMGSTAFKMLLKIIIDKEWSPLQVEIMPKLIVRESSSPLRPDSSSVVKIDP